MIISELEEAARKILEACDPNPDREGTSETPERFAKSMRFLTSGYDVDPKDVLKTFEDGAETYDQMIVQLGIPFYSLCEHHLLPFFGTVDIGYIPTRRIVGLSKFSRLVDVFARRFQVQERMTTQIVDALTTALDPVGAGAVVKARHLCMECRGVERQGSETITSSLYGEMRLSAEVRAEFLELSKGSR